MKKQNSGLFARRRRPRRRTRGRRRRRRRRRWWWWWCGTAEGGDAVTGGPSAPRQRSSGAVKAARPPCGDETAIREELAPRQRPCKPPRPAAPRRPANGRPGAAFPAKMPDLRTCRSPAADNRLPKWQKKAFGTTFVRSRIEPREKRPANNANNKFKSQ